jgi:hypothetical protein
MTVPDPTRDVEQGTLQRALHCGDESPTSPPPGALVSHLVNGCVLLGILTLEES